MIFISHRGNLCGPCPKRENRPAYIIEALNQNCRVEIDVWYDNGWYLGHDKPEHKTSSSWLEEHESFLFIHCKNKNSLNKLYTRAFKKFFGLFNFFWHTDEDYVLTSRTFLWVYPGAKLIKNCIAVLPEKQYNGDLTQCYGVCTDEVKKYQKLYA